MTKGLGAPTVLVIEDNVDNRAIMTAWLEHAGYRVVLARDGTTGVSVAREELPDVILLDIVLPQLDGWTAAQRIRSCTKTKAIPIIALTALTLPNDRRHAEQVGIDGYLSKPVELVRVLEEIERVLAF